MACRGKRRSRKINGVIITYLSDIRTLPDPLVCKTALSVLPEDRREKILRQKYLPARKRNMGAGLLLDYALRKAGCKSRTDIRYNDYGKPFIRQIPFNLSHSGDYVILSIQETAGSCGTDTALSALSGEYPSDAMLIGCDIEQIQKYNPKIAGRFFTDREFQELEKIRNPDAQAELFFRYWTRKESVLKLTGLGMALPMDLFDVSTDGLAVAEREKTAAWYEALKEKRRPEYRLAYEILRKHTLYLKEYRHQDYIITVCGTQKEFSPAVQPVIF